MISDVLREYPNINCLREVFKEIYSYRRIESTMTRQTWQQEVGESMACNKEVS